jgi:hypothetical protein
MLCNPLIADGAELRAAGASCEQEPRTKRGDRECDESESDPTHVVLLPEMRRSRHRTQ